METVVDGSRRAPPCPQGHPYDEKNTRIRPNGARACRRCETDRSLAWYHNLSQERKDDIAFKRLLRRYGLTQEEYGELIARFDGRCWICKGAPVPNGTRNEDPV